MALCVAVGVCGRRCTQQAAGKQRSDMAGLYHSRALVTYF